MNKKYGLIIEDEGIILPGPFNSTTGSRKSLQQLQKDSTHLQYLLMLFSSTLSPALLSLRF